MCHLVDEVFVVIVRTLSLLILWGIDFWKWIESSIIEGDSKKEEGSLNNALWFRWMQPFRLLNKSVQSVKDTETVRVTVLVKKTYLGFLAATFIAFIDIIYLAITIFPDLFSNQVVSLYTGEKWLWCSILFVPLLEEIPYLPAHQKLYFQLL